MATPPQPRAAGAFIALAVLVGAIAGGLAGQPSIGVLIGIGVGVAVAVGSWLLGRR